MTRYFVGIVLVSFLGVQGQAQTQPSAEEVIQFLNPAIPTPLEGVEEIDTNTDKRRIDYGEIAEPGKLDQDLEDYVDRRFQKRKSCLHRPARPAWAYATPREYSQFGRIADLMYSIEKSRIAQSATECSCEVVYPEWNTVFEEFQAFIDATEPGTSIYDLLPEFRRKASEADANSPYRDICTPSALRALQ